VVSSAIARFAARKTNTNTTATANSTCNGLLTTNLSSDVNLALRFRLKRSAKFSECLGVMEPLVIPSIAAKILGDVSLIV